MCYYNEKRCKTTEALIREQTSAFLPVCWRSSSASEVVGEITHVNPLHIITLRAHIVRVASYHLMLARTSRVLEKTEKNVEQVLRREGLSKCGSRGGQAC
jgi:hypothetical protein